MTTAQLNILWLAHDELAFYGLPRMLSQVPTVRRHVICQDTAGAEEHLAREPFDVNVFPLSAYGPRVSALAQNSGAKLVLTLSETAALHPGLAHGRTVDAWFLEQCLTLDVLRDTFRQLALPTTAPHRLLNTGNQGTLRSARRGNRLTARELSVLRLLVQGLTNQQIARALGISVHGVKRHISNLMLKFDCSNRTEVALAATRIWE
ncbi:hypothetical protein GCM10018793_69290 [Streptomyces sulfonofaciens]|uniref:HTH luxR-type domain-containing protein n=1 Tax=Streptomyces sulfonofaciens TaxID=68272 RepID=A0A919GQD7_9ACTN|nr:LuxR C-terminal-related transcriptional regulator [Streptomyces sulfonofaciens]GHH88701.1 hypothetical protein GCM10018793_69290 [Streptomyces sulfonofaciens]